MVLPCEFLLHDISFTAKRAIILPYIEKEKEEFNKPAPVFFTIKIVSARRAKMNIF